MAASLPNQCSSMNKNGKEERDDSTMQLESFQRYREIISILPREEGWGYPLCLYEGFWYPIQFLEGVMFVKEHFQARPDDVLLITPPKCGTTWLKALIFAIMKRTCYTNSTHPLLTNNPHECIRILENNLFRAPPVADVENLPSPRLFATHIPYTSLPESILHSGCKIVYISRDPKDAFISLWSFISKVKTSKEFTALLPLEEAFELFSKGRSGFGPIWDHVQGYLKASLECSERFFFATYEEMKRDTLVKVKRLAEFLGKPFSVEEERERVVEDIIDLCSFDRLKNLEVNKSGSHGPYFTNDAYFRKGEVGDWRNHLTPQMVESLDQITTEKLSGILNEKK